MEENNALKLLRILQRNGEGGPMSDAQVRKLTGFLQWELDLCAERLEAEGMLFVERTYTLTEE